MHRLPKAGKRQRSRGQSVAEFAIRAKGDRRGQGLVEFALIVPVFLLFLLIAVDFGRLLFTYIQLSNSARETAAYAAFNPTTATSQLTTIATRESNVQAQRGEGTITATSSCTTSAGVTITCSAASGGVGAGNRITVNVSEKFKFFTPIIGTFWPGGGIPVSASATAAVTDFAAGGGTPPSCTTLPPTPTFTWQSPDPLNHPFLISVDAGASTSLASPCQNVGYNWDFGGLSTPTNPEDPFREGVTMDYEFATAGTYIVSLVVSNAAGDSLAVTQTIVLGTSPCNAPTSTFTISPAWNGRNGNNSNWQAGSTSFTFDGQSSAFMSDPACHPRWSWNLGDGTTLVPPTATGTPPAHVYASSFKNNTVTVTLVVTNDGGTHSSSQNIDLK